MVKSRTPQGAVHRCAPGATGLCTAGVMGHHFGLARQHSDLGLRHWQLAIIQPRLKVSGVRDILVVARQALKRPIQI